jgi:hypothetical protein
MVGEREIEERKEGAVEEKRGRGCTRSLRRKESEMT